MPMGRIVVVAVTNNSSTLHRKPCYWIALLLGFCHLVSVAAWSSLPAIYHSRNQSRKSARHYVQLTMTTNAATATASANSEKDSTTSTAHQPQPQHLILPNLPLPPPLCSNIPGTWAYDTMSRRVAQEILARTLADCTAHPPPLHLAKATEWETVLSNIKALSHELEHAAATTPLAPLAVPPFPQPSLHGPSATTNTIGSPETPPRRWREYLEWQAILQPHLDTGATWLSAPWMVTEFYLYRRLMDCLDYWNPDSVAYHYDPFDVPKRKGLTTSVSSAEAALSKLQRATAQWTSANKESFAGGTSDEPPPPPTEFSTGVILATQLSLWGNQMDLSLWPADTDLARTDVFADVLQAATTQLLHDDSDRLVRQCWKLWQQDEGSHVDIIVDNAGFELVTDLALAQFLIDSKIAGTVTFQLKSHPTFVSDAMEKDLIDTVNYYADELDAAVYPASVQAGQTWRSLLQSGQWRCVEQDFWVQGRAMWDMPWSVRSDLVERCHLAFVKGDANYRRLLGDRDWDLTAPFDQVVGCYFPVPVCALRTLKAEIGCGMEASQVQRAASLDANWMTNGRFGVVHFGKGAGK
jgi:Damage-control phosphatase ARMT1-like domain